MEIIESFWKTMSPIFFIPMTINMLLIYISNGSAELHTSFVGVQCRTLGNIDLTESLYRI